MIISILSWSERVTNELTETRKIMIKNNHHIDLYNSELNNIVAARHSDSVQFILNYFLGENDIFWRPDYSLTN